MLNNHEIAEEPVYMPPSVQRSDGQMASGQTEGLKPRITLFAGVMVVVGSIIGSGIFITPKGVHENSGSVAGSLIVWTMSGLFSGVGAYCYAELGTFIMKSGGDYAYIRVAFGSLVAFVRLWIEAIIIRPCALTVVAMTFAMYIMQPFFPDCETPKNAPQIFAALILLLLTFVNSYSVRWVTHVQNVFTIAKLGALLLIIFTGIVLLCMGEPYGDSLHNAWENAQMDVGKLSLAFYSGLFAFNGWNYLNFITEELQNPLRDLPIAIAISISLVTIVYVMTNVAFYAGLTNSQLVQSSAVAVTFGNKFYGSMAWIMPVFVALSCIGALNGILLTSSRLFLVAARQNHMPAVLAMINPVRETPIPAVMFTGFLSLLYLFLSDNVYSLINCCQVVNWLAIGCATLALLYLRYKMPCSKYPRPIKVNLIFPIIFLLGCVFLVVVPIIHQPIDTLIGLGIMLSSLPVYYVFIGRENKSNAFERLSRSFTTRCQKLLLLIKPREEVD